MKEEYDYSPYPEDIKEKISLRHFEDEFKRFSPIVHPESAEDFENEELTELDEPIDEKTSAYGKIPEYARVRPLTRSDSTKHKE